MSTTGSQSSSSGSSWFSAVKPFLFGGISGCVATATIQPIDTIKVRIQIMGEAGEKKGTGLLRVGTKIIKQEGITALYSGLSSALFRQMTYGTVRFGLYRSMYNKRMKANGEVPLHEKTLLSMIAGFVGALVGNPSDLILVRFQSDSTLPPDQRRNYKSLFDAFYRICKDDGVWTLWRGSTPTVVRAISMNVGQLASYDQFREFFTKMRGQWDTPARLYTVICAGVVCACASLPADNLKTKLMKMKKGADGTLPYKNMLDCFFKSVKKEGILGLWIGLPTYIVRVGPHSIVSLLMLDTLTRMFPNEDGSEEK